MATLAGSYLGLHGQNLRLHWHLANSPDAEIFAVGDDLSRIANIFTSPDSAREAKLRAMIDNAPPDASLFCRDSFVCWPESLILNHGGDLAGVVMPRIDFAENRPLLSYCDPSQKQSALHLRWPYLVRLAI